MSMRLDLTELTDNQLHCHFSAASRMLVVYTENWEPDIMPEFEFEKKCDSGLTNH